MRLATLARRTVAVTAATAMLTSGVIALSEAAYAVGPTPVVSSATPDASNNTTSIPVTINGSGFVPATAKVDFIPTFTGTEVATIGNLAPNLQTSSSNVLNVTVPLTMAAPGAYNIVVRQQDVDATGPITVSSAPCLSCFSVTSLGPATASTIVKGVQSSNTSRGANAIDISGTNIAKGARVVFYKTNCQEDTAVSFVPGDKSIANTNTGYPSATSLHGNFAVAAGFEPGRHFVRIINTDNKILNPNDCTAGTAEFYLPYFTANSIVPASRGAYSTNQVVTLTGQGFRQGSTLDIADLDTAQGCTDRTMGPSTVSPDGTTITATISLVNNTSGCSGINTGGRAVTVTGPDSASYTLSNQFYATPAPTVGTLNTPKLGRGGSVKITINGSGFVGSLVGDVCTGCTQFTFGGGGVTAVTTKVNSASQAEVQVTATPDAVTGGRTVTAVNPDFGTSSTGADFFGTFPLTITNAPVAVNLTPASGAMGTTKNVVIQGTDFGGASGNDGMQVSVSGTGVTAGNPTLSNGQNGANDTATVSFVIAANAPAGLRDVILKNPVDFGTYTCLGCFGVDSLAVSPGADSNSNPSSTLTLTGVGLASNSVATLFRVGTPMSSGVTAAVSPTTGNNGTATFNLVDQAPGKYNLSVTTAGDPLTCASCFSITGQAPTLTAIDPVEAGQGAVNVPFTVIGTKIARGTQVLIGGVTTHDVVWVDNTKLTGLLDVPANATTGDKDVQLVNADGALKSNVLSGAFALNAGPVVKTIAPAAVGQGATAFEVTLTGPGFVSAADGAPGSSVDFGEGITVTEAVVTQGATSPTNSNPDDTLKATINVVAGAILGSRDVSVVNPDQGRSTLTGKFTVNVGPKVSTVQPTVLRRGIADQAITITGADFAQGATPTIDGVTFSATPTVSEDGTTITGNASVAADTSRGARDVVVVNPADKGRGVCAGCFTIADVPSAPTINSATPGKREATFAWSAPADNGGSPITAYVLSAGDTVEPVTVAGDVLTAKVTGLTPGQQYTFSLIARNAQGDSPAATRTVRPFDSPTPPSSVTATAKELGADVSWSGAVDNGSNISHYTVVGTPSTGDPVSQEVAGTVTSFSFSGLTAGVAYTFKVKAENAGGYGELSNPSSPVTPFAPRTSPTLTAAFTAATVTAGSPTTVSGVLRTSGGAPIVGATIAVKRTPDIGASATSNVTTNSNGVWSLTFRPVYNTVVTASFAGNDTSSAKSVTTARKIVRVRLANSYTKYTKASTVLTIKGTTTPNKAGRTVYLYRQTSAGNQRLAAARVASNGTYVFNIRLAQGNYRLVTYLGATSGNGANFSPAFIVVRTAG